MNPRMLISLTLTASHDVTAVNRHNMVTRSAVIHYEKHRNIRESSLNMTRGDEDIEGRGAPKIRRALKKLGGFRKFVYFKTSRRRGAPKKLNRWRGGLLKFQASSFNIFILSPCHIK